MAVKSKLIGATEVRRAINSLPDEYTKGLKKSLEAGARVVQRKAKSKAPPGDIRDAITRQRLQKGLRWKIGITSRSYKKNDKGSRTAHLIEFGTSAHRINVEFKRVLSDGQTVYGRSVMVGPIQPRPFLNPSFLLSLPIITPRIQRDFERTLLEVNKRALLPKARIRR